MKRTLVLVALAGAALALSACDPSAAPIDGNARDFDTESRVCLETKFRGDVFFPWEDTEYMCAKYADRRFATVTGEWGR